MGGMSETWSVINCLTRNTQNSQIDGGNMPSFVLFFYANLYFKRLTCENNLPRCFCLNFQFPLSFFKLISDGREKNHQTPRRFAELAKQKRAREIQLKTKPKLLKNSSN